MGQILHSSGSASYRQGHHFRPGQKSKISTEIFNMFNHDLLVIYESIQQNKD